MLDLNALSAALEQYSKVARIVIADVKGSAPREVGTSMLVWADGYSGTIGGGRLEWEAINNAQAMLDGPLETKVVRQALGPSLNQCCGGSVIVVTEIFDSEKFHALENGFEFQGIWARRVETGELDLPKTLRRKIERFENSDQAIPLLLSKGWLVEPVWREQRQVYIYGAGNVGAALAHILAPIPEFDVYVSDVREHLFDNMPDTVKQDYFNLPTDVMAAADDNAEHFIMTPEHDYDLELCHQLLGRKFRAAGLIGSATKWARFRKRLINLGHTEQQVDRIICPIGDPSFGKHPQMIAISVASHLLKAKAGFMAQGSVTK